jgi:hypothetical protein
MTDALRSIEAAIAHLRVAVNDLDLHSGDPLLLRRAKLLHSDLSVFSDELIAANRREKSDAEAGDLLVSHWRRLRLKMYGPKSIATNEEGHRANDGPVTELTTT